jgi:hypothetical protein
MCNVLKYVYIEVVLMSKELLCNSSLLSLRELCFMLIVGICCVYVHLPCYLVFG